MGLSQSGPVNAGTIVMTLVIGSLSVVVLGVLRWLGERRPWGTGAVALASGCGAAASASLARFTTGGTANLLMIFAGTFLIAAGVSNWFRYRQTDA